MADALMRSSDQLICIREDADYVVFVIKKCPVSWRRTSDVGICHGAIGMLQGPLHWLLDRDKLGRESIWQYQWHPGFTNEAIFSII